MKVFKLAAASLLLGCIGLVSAPAFSADPAAESFSQAKATVSQSDDERVRRIGDLVNEAESGLQATLDDLRKQKDAYGKDWDIIEEGFVYYSRTEADYFRALLEEHLKICLALDSKADCKTIAANAVESAARDMVERSEMVRNVALKRKVPAFNNRLTEDAEGPLNRAIRRELAEEDKVPFFETSRLFLRVKMTYIGLIEQLALSNKLDYRAAMVESEMVAQEKHRVELLKALWSITGKEAVKPRPIGEKRREAMLYEFDVK